MPRGRWHGPAGGSGPVPQRSSWARRVPAFTPRVPAGCPANSGTARLPWLPLSSAGGRGFGARKQRGGREPSAGAAAERPLRAGARGPPWGPAPAPHREQGLAPLRGEGAGRMVAGCPVCRAAGCPAAGGGQAGAATPAAQVEVPGAHQHQYHPKIQASPLPPGLPVVPGQPCSRTQPPGPPELLRPVGMRQEVHPSRQSHSCGHSTAPGRDTHTHTPLGELLAGKHMLDVLTCWARSLSWHSAARSRAPDPSSRVCSRAGSGTGSAGGFAPATVPNPPRCRVPPRHPRGTDLCRCRGCSSSFWKQTKQKESIAPTHPGEGESRPGSAGEVLASSSPSAVLPVGSHVHPAKAMVSGSPSHRWVSRSPHGEAAPGWDVSLITLAVEPAVPGATPAPIAQRCSGGACGV